jgi:hypothetical protein
MADLSEFEGLAQTFDDGVEIGPLIHPVTGKPTDMFVTVASYQSERVKALQRKIGNKALRDEKRNPRKAVATTEEIEAKSYDIAATAVLAWRGFQRKGVDIPCTIENVRALLANPDFWWVVEAIDKAADDLTLFTQASKKKL